MLTPQEEAELAALEQEEAMASQQAAPSGLTPEEEQELAMLEQEEMQAQQMPAPEINQNREASLGVFNRSRFALEPLESNRRALLQQEFGAENVMEDEQGNLYLNQDGQFLPVDKPGFSVANAADIAGALPEMAGAGLGALVGGGAGAVAGAGAASIPAAAYGAAKGGAVGGVAGSAIRQGLSALMGTPQVATGMERATEAGLSGLFSAVGAGGGQAVKMTAQKVAPFVKQAGGEFIDMFRRAPKGSVTKGAIEGTLEQIPRSADEIMGSVADQSGRAIVQEEAENLGEIALRQNLPQPTYAQTAGGKAILAEAELLDTPLIGGRVRQQVDKQLEAVKKNLEKVAGKFINSDNDSFEVGMRAREIAESSLKSRKSLATKLYDQVDTIGKDAMLGKKTFFNKFRDYAGELGVISPDLKRTKYAADSGLTRDEFSKIQNALFDGLDAIKRTQSPKIRFESVNAVRKTMRNTAEELKMSNPNAHRLLNKFARELEETAEGVLNRESPKLGEVFREANKNYAKFKNLEEFAEKIFKDGVGDEKTVRAVMSDSAKVEGLKELIGENGVKEIGKNYVKGILDGLSKSGVGRADTALTAIKKNAAQVKAALGEKTYNDLMDNLYYLNRLNQPLGVARKSLLGAAFEENGIRKLGLSLMGSAKNLAVSKGVGDGQASKAAKEFAGKTFDTVGRKVTPKNVGRAANFITDESQRAGAYFTRGPAPKFTRKEEKENGRMPSRSR